MEHNEESKPCDGLEHTPSLEANTVSRGHALFSKLHPRPMVLTLPKAVTLEYKVPHVVVNPQPQNYFVATSSL